jgi:hypothetical protein
MGVISRRELVLLLGLLTASCGDRRPTSARVTLTVEGMA